MNPYKTKHEDTPSVETTFKSPLVGLSETPDGNTISMSLPVPAEREARPVLADAGSSYWATALALIGIDVLAIASVTGLLGLIAATVGSAPDWTVYFVGGAATALLPLVYGIAGLYHVTDAHPSEELRRMSTTTLGAGGGALVMAIFQAPTLVPVIAGVVGLATVVVPACRVLGRILLARTDWWGVPVVVLGKGPHGKAVITTLKRWPELGLRPVALLDEEHLDDYDGVPRPAGPDRAPNMAGAFSIPFAIIALPNLSYEERSRMIAHLGKFFRRLFVVPEGFGAEALWTTRSSSRGLLGFEVKHFRLSHVARGVKRGIDLVGAGVGLVLLAPLLATIASLIKLGSRGPVLFKQARMGIDGRCFTVLKFRTMHTDAESKLQDLLDSDPKLRAQYEQYHKLPNDPRVTRVGKWLRRLSLDELPQLWNVVRGDMSLVGPRAYMPGELPKMNGMSRTVLQCPPGLTGLWQVSGRNNLDFSTRVDLDVHYMQNWTVWLDLYILIRTIPVVLTGDGAN